MPTATIVYEGNLRTTATHVRSGNQLITDAPVDNRGKGEAFSPTDLVATSLASCILTIMGIAASGRAIDMDGARAEVIKEMDGPPRRISAIRVKIVMPAKGYSEKERQVLLNAAEACPVGRSLHPDLEEDITLIWADDK